MILTTIIWLIIVSLFRWQWQLSLIWLWLGGLLGAFAPEIGYFKSLKTAFHSQFFQLILYVLGFFVLTSTGSLFGVGIVMGMALHLIYEEIKDLSSTEPCFSKTRNRDLIEHPESQKKLFVLAMILIFIGFHLLLIYRF